MRPSRPEGNRRATPGASPGHRESGPVAAGRTEPHAGRAVATLHPCPSARRRQRALQAEELSLDAEAARVAPDPPAGRDHAMAGDDDGDRVVPERLADRAAPVRLADAARDLSVGHHLAGGHGRGVPVQRLERFERPAVGGELAPALERPEPAPERRRAPPIAEQQRDQLIVVPGHGRTPPSAARSFLSAWYTLARAASSLPPSA